MEEILHHLIDKFIPFFTRFFHVPGCLGFLPPSVGYLQILISPIPVSYSPVPSKQKCQVTSWLPGSKAHLAWRSGRLVGWTNPSETYGVFPKIGVPQNGWFIMENPMNKWMIWGYPYSWKHPYFVRIQDGLSWDILKMGGRIPEKTTRMGRVKDP